MLYIKLDKRSFASRKRQRYQVLVLLSCCGRFGIFISFLLESPIVFAIVALII